MNRIQRIISVLLLVAVHLMKAADAEQWLPLPVVRAPDGYQLSHDDEIAPEFYAFRSTVWPNGLVPIFGYEVRGVYRLSRKPKTGWENLMEPVFFALPATNETDTAKITGQWFVTATHIDDHTDDFSWELTVHDDQIAGRFDLHTDYRFASITGGTWRSNRMEIQVRYVNERFELSGILKNENLHGTWRRTDDGDKGTWMASRASPPTYVEPAEFESVELLETISPETTERRYSIKTGNELRSEESQKVIARVWKPHGVRKKAGTRSKTAP